MTRDSETEGAGRRSPNGRWSSRMPWLVAAAAAVALLAALAVLLPGGEDGGLETIEPSEVEVEPEQVQPTPAPAEPTEAAPPSIGDRLQEATALESAELLTDLYSPAVDVSVEGVVFPEGAGYDFVTDTGMADLIDVRITDCVDSGDAAMSCAWSLDFSFLAGTVPVQRGTAELTVDGDEIASLDLVSENIEEVASGLALYRGWVEADAGDAADLFTSLGTIVISGELADRHRDAAADFLDATDVAADPANIGAMVMAAMRAADDATNRRIYRPSVSWTENPIGTLAGEEMFAVFASSVFAELALFEIHSCVDQAGTVRCRFEVAYPLVPALKGVLGDMEISVGPDGLVEAIESDLEEPAWTEHTTALLDYREWLTAEFSATDPGIVNRMFWLPTLMAATSESVELHRELGSQWSETYSE